MISGVLLMGSAAGLTGYNLHNNSVAAETSASILNQLHEKIDEQPKDTSIPIGITGVEPSAEEETPDPDRAMPTIMVDGRAYIGSITIPSLGLELPVAQDWDYQQMNISPCRYSGSVYRNDLVICAHNYNTLFWNIKDMKKDDSVIFTDAEGIMYKYKVTAVESLGSRDVGEMVDSDSDLSLFTCNYMGNARVTVRCDLIEK